MVRMSVNLFPQNSIGHGYTNKLVLKDVLGYVTAKHSVLATLLNGYNVATLS